MNALREALRQWWEGLTEREKRLVRALGVLTAILLVSVPVYVMSSAIDAVQAENEQLAAVIAEIERAGDRLAELEAEREAVQARYRQRAPGLATFVSARAEPLHMTIGSVTNQPDVQEGRYRRRHVRVSFPGTTLRQAVRLMAELESAPFPIAIERIHIDHFQEGDHYNLELGVITYDREGAEDGAAGEGAAQARKGVVAAPARPGAGRAESSARAGPPPPP